MVLSLLSRQSKEAYVSNNEQIRKQIGNRIRELRKAKGWSQEKAAQEIGCSWRAIQRWEKGTVTPQWGSIEMLAKTFGVSTDQIMGTVDVKGQGIEPEPLNVRVDKLTLRLAALQAQVDQLLRERDNRGIQF